MIVLHKMFLLLKIYVEAFSTFEHQNLNCSKTSIYARLKFSVMYALFTSVSEQQQQSLAQTGGCEVPPWIKLVKRLLQQQCKWKPLKACIIMSNSAFDTRVLNLEFFRWKKKLPLCGYKEAQEAPICKKKKDSIGWISMWYHCSVLSGRCCFSKCPSR